MNEVSGSDSKVVITQKAKWCFFIFLLALFFLATAFITISNRGDLQSRSKNSIEYAAPEEALKDQEIEAVVSNLDTGNHREIYSDIDIIEVPQKQVPGVAPSKTDDQPVQTSNPQETIPQPEEKGIREEVTDEVDPLFWPNWPNPTLLLSDNPDLRKKMVEYYKSLGEFTDKDRYSYLSLDSETLYSWGQDGDLLALDVLLRLALKKRNFNAVYKLNSLSMLHGNATLQPIIYDDFGGSDRVFTKTGLAVKHLLFARMGHYTQLFYFASATENRNPQRSEAEREFIEKQSLELLKEINMKRERLGLQPLPIKPDNDIVQYYKQLFSGNGLEAYLVKYLNFDIEEYY